VVTWEGLDAVSDNATGNPIPNCGNPSNKRRSIFLVTTMTVTP